MLETLSSVPQRHLEACAKVVTDADLKGKHPVYLLSGRNVVDGYFYPTLLHGSISAGEA